MPGTQVVKSHDCEGSFQSPGQMEHSSWLVFSNEKLVHWSQLREQSTHYCFHLLNSSHGSLHFTCLKMNSLEILSSSDY